MSKICALSQVDRDGGWDCIAEDCAWWVVWLEDEKPVHGTCSITALAGAAMTYMHKAGYWPNSPEGVKEDD